MEECVGFSNAASELLLRKPTIMGSIHKSIASVRTLRSLAPGESHVRSNYGPVAGAKSQQEHINRGVECSFAVRPRQMKMKLLAQSCPFFS